MAPFAHVHSQYHSHKPRRCGWRYWRLCWSFLHSAPSMQTRHETAGSHLLQPVLVLHIAMPCRHGLDNILLDRTRASNLTGTWAPSSAHAPTEP